MSSTAEQQWVNNLTRNNDDLKREIANLKRQLEEAQKHVLHLMTFAESRMDDEDKYSLNDPYCEKCQAAKKWRDAAIASITKSGGKNE